MELLFNKSSKSLFVHPTNTKDVLLQNISNDAFDVFDLNLYSIFHSAAHQLTLMMEA